MNEKISKLLTPIAILAVGLLISGTIIYFNWDKVSHKSGQNSSIQQIADKVINYLNKNYLSPQGLSASLSSTTEESGFYKLIVKINEKEYPAYVSKDGKYLFVYEPINLDTELTDQGNQSQENQSNKSSSSVEKRERPDIKIFVMSYCPYGLQMEKAFLPVYNLLKNKTDMGIYFVNYIMHNKQELDENLRQYCLEKEQKDHYYAYLNCFVKDGNYEKCLSEAQIDQNKLATCIEQTDKNYKITESYNDKSTWLNGYYPKFDVHADLNEKYGVRGSPTVVINDQVVNINTRSPEEFKKIVCQAFVNAPAECSQTLSNETASPGFGLETGSTNSGSCQ
ncbi:MAG: DsbA family protein [Minisyncoccales bacterium]